MAYDVRRWLAVLALIAGVLGLLQLRSAWHCKLLEVGAWHVHAWRACSSFMCV